MLGRGRQAARDKEAPHRANARRAARGETPALLLGWLHPSHRQARQSVGATSPDRQGAQGQGQGQGQVVSPSPRYPRQELHRRVASSDRFGNRAETTRSAGRREPSHLAPRRKTKRPRIAARPFRFLVEPRGIEPLTSRVRLWRRSTVSRCCSGNRSPARFLRRGIWGTVASHVRRSRRRSPHPSVGSAPSGSGLQRVLDIVAA